MLGAERVAHLKEVEAAERATWEVEKEELRQQAAARSFTGAKFNATLPLKGIVAAIQRDITSTLAAGHLPTDHYRVTSRARTEIVIWTWHRGATTRAILEQLAQAYNQCEGGAGYGTRDRYHFWLRFEEPRPAETKALDAERRHGTLSYDEVYQKYEPLITAARTRDTEGCPCWETGDCAPREVTP